ncbi:MAG: hypothetical protein AAGJ46_01195 [Planctomycetota bacterium]
MPLISTVADALLWVWFRVWALPYSLLGAAVGLAGLPLGGSAQIRRGVLEFYGGAIASLLRRAPIAGGAAALTLGHVILGQTQQDLDFARDHEHVHVRQFERWGPLMGPAYVGASLWLACRRSGDCYRDNPFEREAYDEDERRRSGLRG